MKSISDAVYERLAESPLAILDIMGEAEVDVPMPSWAKLLFAFCRDGGSLDVSFFEDATDFFLWYAKVLVRRKDDMVTASLQQEVSGHWQVFAPPTLVGVNIRTRLRF